MGFSQPQAEPTKSQQTKSLTTTKSPETYICHLLELRPRHISPSVPVLLVTIQRLQGLPCLGHNGVVELTQHLNQKIPIVALFRCRQVRNHMPHTTQRRESQEQRPTRDKRQETGERWSVHNADTRRTPTARHCTSSLASPAAHTRACTYHLLQRSLPVNNLLSLRL